MSKFLSPRLTSLDPYVPGEQPKDKKYIKLNTNENPYPPCAGVFDLMNKNEAENLKLYSDPDCTKLTEAVCRCYNIKKENVIFGNGSDEILAFAFSAFCDKATKAVFPDISYGFYKVFAQLNCIDYDEIPLREDFTVSPDDYKNAGGTIFIANPNAPTGLCLSTAQVEEILKSNPENVVVIDEAYADFSETNCLSLIDKYENLLIVRTFSKSRSLAGARLGYAIGNKELISDLQMIRNSNNPYNINRLTQSFGVCAMDDKIYFDACIKKIKETRKYLTEQLDLRGFETLDSQTNFIFTKSDKINGKLLYELLKKEGILVRHFDKKRILSYNRITIGTMEETKKLLCAIDKILQKV